MVSSSSSSELGQDIRNLIHERREAKNLYSEATLEVGHLEQCLDAIKTTLSASKEETNVAQMRADESHARAASKISLKSLCFYIRDFIR
jgi:septation ring formation regulator EzrA